MEKLGSSGKIHDLTTKSISYGHVLKKNKILYIITLSNQNPSLQIQRMKPMNEKKEINFKNPESLQSIVNVVNEAAVAINNKNRVITDSPIAEVLGSAIGAGLGGVGTFAALYGLGTVGLSAAGITSALATAGGIVGGGMAAGLFVMAAPIVVLGAAGYGISSHLKNQKFQQEKERLYKEAIKMHEAIIRALQDEAYATKERMEYLQSLNILLQRAVRDLKSDLDSKNGTISLYRN